MTEECYLLDVNVLVALTFRDHAHHRTAARWFDVPGKRRWALSMVTEMGFLRVAMKSRPAAAQWDRVRALLHDALEQPRLEYVTSRESWSELTLPFAKRIHGPAQVTDAYLLGLAIRENLIVATFDKGFLHLAGEQYRSHVLVLGAT